LPNAVLEMLLAYQQHSENGQTPALKQHTPDFLATEMKVLKWVREGGLTQENFQTLLGPYLEHSQHMHHPGFIGHQVAVPHEGSTIADMIHGVINNPMAVYEMGPTASVLERVVVNWMLEKVGWLNGPVDGFEFQAGHGSGVLTHGGSLANLTAVLAARAHACPEAWEQGTPDNLAIITPAISHYSMARAISIAGFGAKAAYPAPVDALGVLRPEDLEATYKSARDDGRQVILVSANACATATGLYDPLDEVADFCQAHKLWFHVDGAHGASALVSDKYKHRLRGVHRADSLTWDAHKMMRTSALSAAILFKDASTMASTFHQDASYIFYGDDRPGFDVGPFAIECTKSALGTKLFMVLAMEGEQGIGQFVEKQYEDTLDFYHLINSQDDFECPYVPEANILCFRYLGAPDNAAQQTVRAEVLKRGNFYITSAEVNGMRYLRLSVMNPLTTRETIVALLEEIRECA
ncbi:MAG TPA: aminotransferase class I/II-fold pyridoxal phosphate-dependent enzyme, partial [Hellea balneolensis]|nr:aminotransferase class I/II-fold pyridoxal phosphate-dependent enzyme [Hellea balneolensis]